MAKCGCCGEEQEATKQKSTEKSPSIEILKERFARGEIDKAEFEDRRKVLAEA